MKCEAANARGKRCGADAMRGSRRCFWHSPATTRAAREARRRGGQNRMLALRDPALVTPTEIVQAASAEPPEWWKLERRADVLGAVRDVGRAVLARRLAPREANTVLLAMKLLLDADESRRADRRARREWARDQLRERINVFRDEIRRAKTSADLEPVERELAYIRELIGRITV